MKKSSLLLALAFVLVLTISSSSQTLAFKWQSDTLLRVPESVLADAKSNILYVANINGKPDEKDGNGFISQLTPDGKIKKLQWVTGLNAPKGMGIANGKLYVADVTAVVVIDIATAKISSTIEIEGAQFLNDVTTDEKGNVYISDSSTGKVHIVSNGKASVFLEGKEFTRPNGLLAQKEGLYLIDFGTGTFYKIGWDKTISKVCDVAQGGDGIALLDKDKFLISSWHGEVYEVTKAGAVQKLLDTKEKKLNSADIDYDGKTKMLYIPTFFGNSVSAYMVGK